METTDPAATGSPPRLVRTKTNRWIAGVSGGLADYLGTDPTLIRLAFVAMTILGGFGLPLYVLAWLIIPGEGEADSIGERLVAGLSNRTVPPAGS